MKLSLTTLNQWDHIETLYSNLHKIRDRGYYGPITVNLASCDFVPAEGLLGLLTAARLWHGWTNERMELINIQQAVHQYAERADLFKVGGRWVTTHARLRRRYERAAGSCTILELTRLDSNELVNAGQVARVRRRAEQILTTWLPQQEERVDRLVTILAEIAENVIHSRDVGFLVAQRYRDNMAFNEEYRVVVGIADLGIGIQQSFAESPEPIMAADGSPLKHGSDFVKRALDRGVTSREGNSGLGLDRVKTIVSQWDERLRVRSGSSLVHYDPAGEHISDDLVHVPGAQIFVQVHS